MKVHHKFSSESNSSVCFLSLVANRNVQAQCNQVSDLKPNTAPRPSPRCTESMMVQIHVLYRIIVGLTKFSASR